MEMNQHENEENLSTSYHHIETEIIIKSDSLEENINTPKKLSNFSKESENVIEDSQDSIRNLNPLQPGELFTKNLLSLRISHSVASPKDDQVTLLERMQLIKESLDKEEEPNPMKTPPKMHNRIAIENTELPHKICLFQNMFDSNGSDNKKVMVSELDIQVTSCQKEKDEKVNIQMDNEEIEELKEPLLKKSKPEPKKISTLTKCKNNKDKDKNKDKEKNKSRRIFMSVKKIDSKISLFNISKKSQNNTMNTFYIQQKGNLSVNSSSSINNKKDTINSKASSRYSSSRMQTQSQKKNLIPPYGLNSKKIYPNISKFTYCPTEGNRDKKPKQKNRSKPKAKVNFTFNPQIVQNLRSSMPNNNSNVNTDMKKFTTNSFFKNYIQKKRVTSNNQRIQNNNVPVKVVINNSYSHQSKQMLQKPKDYAHFNTVTPINTIKEKNFVALKSKKKLQKLHPQ